MRTREFLAQGMDAESARREAGWRFGDVERARAALKSLGKEGSTHDADAMRR
jgi:hypothetical protein